MDDKGVFAYNSRSMNRLVRKIVFFVFLGLFLLAAPVVVLYTAGYRLNPQRLSLVKTGALFITSDPKNAAVILDNAPTGRDTNEIFKNIISGEHFVRLEKEGYLTWEKRVEVKENETTFLQEVVLFAENETNLLLAGDFTASAFDSRGEKFVYAPDLTEWIEIWSRLLPSGEETLLARLPKNSVDKLAFNWSLDDELLIKKTQNSVETWSQPGKTDEMTNKNPLLVWERDANQTLITKKTEDGIILVRRDAAGAEQTLAALPEGNYEFAYAPPSLVLLRDRTQEKIILVDDRGVDRPILLNTDAFDAAWNPRNEKQLLYASGFELHVFDVTKLTDELLTRMSVPLNGAAWHPSGNNIFYSNSAELYAVELDNRGGSRNIFTLTTMDKIEAFVPTTNGQMLYLIGTRGTETGLFERRL